MKRNQRLMITVSSVLFICVIFLLAETLLVKVQSTHLKSEPQFFAKTLSVLKNGDLLEKLGEEGAWFKVKTSANVTGWVHSSAVQKKKSGLLALNKNLKTEAGAEEVALAGKGFNKQVEADYRNKNKNISFAWVDSMEKIRITTEEMLKFLKKGKLGEYGGSK